MVVRGLGFAPGKTYQLNWNTVVGNRMTAAGWEERAARHRRGKGRCRRPRRVSFQDARRSRRRPRSLGRCRRRKKDRHLWIAPTALPLDVARGPAGTTFRVHIKGVGWSETANIYALVYDNAISGYACGFNSQGDIEIIMQATGAPGWHFIDLYPAIYKGKETRPNNYRLPQLDRGGRPSGRRPAVFRFAFEVLAQGLRADKALDERSR